MVAWTDANTLALPGFLAGLLVASVFITLMPTMAGRSGGATFFEASTRSNGMENLVKPVMILENAKDLEAYLQSESSPTSAKESNNDVQVACQDWAREEEVEPGAQDAWDIMKWVEKPSPCRVRGFSIEMLDPANNFRRGYALGFSGNVEDRSLLPAFFLASQDLALQDRKRRVLIDLGGNTFESSTAWFLRNYPLDFTEVHAFEMVEGLYKIPLKHPLKNEHFSLMDNTSRRHSSTASVGWAPIPNWMLQRIKFYQVAVSNKDGKIEANGKELTKIDITRFMKEDLGLTSNDAVIVKMDIEGSEWDVLPEWATDPEMVGIVDEIFVEVHYKHPTMASHGWMKFPNERNAATQLLNLLRSQGFFVHYWT
eukprot:TRINITY_DN895_c0_g1_i2.p1 TRINITY_DN895_c0_g1~~TRINITY_DN895_c0_g1_i2.p1  ORF type:complete len:369 (+),score=51.39 TRINITY_DN895_c0_g1_i2:204-1310(+)